MTGNRKVIKRGRNIIVLKIKNGKETGIYRIGNA